MIYWYKQYINIVSLCEWDSIIPSVFESEAEGWHALSLKINTPLTLNIKWKWDFKIKPFIME